MPRRLIKGLIVGALTMRVNMTTPRVKSIRRLFPGSSSGMERTIAMASPPLRPPHHMICRSPMVTCGRLNAFTVRGTELYTMPALATRTRKTARITASRRPNRSAIFTDTPTRMNKSVFARRARKSQISSRAFAVF